MKKLKLVAAVLVVSMLTSVFTSCDSKTTSKKKNHSKKDDVASEEIEDEEDDEKKDSSDKEDKNPVKEVEESVSETTTSIPTLDTSLYQVGSYFDVKSDNESKEAQGYFYSIAMAEKLHAENSDLYFGLGYDKVYTYLNSGTADYGFWTNYYVSYDGTEETKEVGSPSNIYAYEDIIKFPMATSMHSNTKGERNIFTVNDSAEDGTYYAELLALSIDGTKALVVLKDPIIISSEEFYNLKPGDRITIPDSDPLYDFDLTIRDDFDPYDPAFTCDVDYMNFSEETFKSTFKNCTFRFYEMENGDFILGSGKYGQSYAGINPRVVIIDIAPDCEIVDDYSTTKWLNPTPYGYSDGINNLTRSYFYYLITTVESPIIYNDWIYTEGTIEPCVIENNTITKMVIPFSDTLFY